LTFSKPSRPQIPYAIVGEGLDPPFDFGTKSHRQGGSYDSILLKIKIVNNFEGRVKTLPYDVDCFRVFKSARPALDDTVIARSAATWQSPGTLFDSALRFVPLYREIATPV